MPHPVNSPEMEQLESFFVSVEKSFTIIAETRELGEELEKLDVAKSELRSVFAQLLKRPDMSKVQMNHALKAAKKRSNQVFQLDFRGGGETEYVTGWHRIAKRLKIGESSIRVYLSKGKGQFTVHRFNPTIEQIDILRVVKLSPIEAVKRAQGRPRKAIDWGRLGTEAPGNPDGTILAESARPMPKTRNRRTDESQEDDV